MSNRHGTASSEGQDYEFASAVVRQLPRGLDPDYRQMLTEKQGLLQRILREAFVLDQQANPRVLVLGFMEVVPFIVPGKSSTSFDEMLQAATEHQVHSGWEDAEAFLANQKGVPKVYRNLWFVFPGEVVMEGGQRKVLTLHYDEYGAKEWVRFWNDESLSFGDLARFVRFCGFTPPFKQ